MSRMRRPNSIASRSVASAMTFDSSPRASACAQRSAPSTTSAYSGICAAAVISDGLVVASRGLSFLIELKSPLSATTTVIAASCCSSVCVIAFSWFWPGSGIGLRSLSQGVGLEGLQKLFQHGDLGADLVAGLGVAHRAQPRMDHDVGHRRNDVGVPDHRGLGALEVVVLRQVD